MLDADAKELVERYEGGKTQSDITFSARSNKSMDAALNVVSAAKSETVNGSGRVRRVKMEMDDEQREEEQDERTNFNLTHADKKRF